MFGPSWRVVALVILSMLMPLVIADPIVEPSITETLVEGHTVFLTIEAYQYAPSDAAPMAPTRASPASGDTAAPGADAMVRVNRFPGVLWFNDQYVVEPRTTASTGLGTGSSVAANYGASMAVLVRADDGRVREPCGGAILAVNEGDPDPRQLLLAIDGRDPLSGERQQRAAIGVDRANSQVYSDGLLTAQIDGALGNVGASLGFDYQESYLLTDPNDHYWIVDKYIGTTRALLPDGELTTFSYPVWASNILGGPVFYPDRDFSLDSNTCLPAKGLVEALSDPVGGSICGVNLLGVRLAGGNESDITFNPYNGAPAWNDDPCMGYQEPSRNGRCYGGQPADPTQVCVHANDAQPLHRYHGVLYFAWEDLVSFGAPKDHCNYDPGLDSDPWSWGDEGGCNPALALDTNGCQSATEWPCPGEEPWTGAPGADDLEGNSHAFHPLAPPHEHAELCQPTDNMTNPANHGGSLYGRSGRCDYHHATARVDVYFSGAGRPPEPLARNFVLVELEGSGSPFMDFHTAFPGVP